MGDQHHYKSLAMPLKSMVTANYYFPDSESALLIFLQSGVEKLPAWAAGD